MTIVALGGCRATPLLSYLQALGVLRLLHEQFAPDLTSHWRGSSFHVEGDVTREAITRFFVEDYEPTPMVSPWNGAGGFRTLKREKGEKAVEAIENSDDPRLASFRVAIAAARGVWDIGLREGWIDEGKTSIFSKTKKGEADKAAFLAACRASFPDEALDWLDASVVLADGGTQYPLLLGTGGNLGRLDLATTYAGAVSGLLNPKQTRRRTELLGHALFGEGNPEMEGLKAGQYAPAAAGTMNSWAYEAGSKGRSVNNPWSVVLGMEGALLFASGVARRFGGSQGKATMPFTVSGTKVGYTAAEGEDVKGEFWAPIWDRAMTVPELRRVIAEGRLSWRGKQATSGVDAAKALSTLGVDRGFSHFERYVIANRFGGRSDLAARVGSFVVTRQPADSVSLLSAVDSWVARVRRQETPTKKLPKAVGLAMGRVDAAQMRLTQNPNTQNPNMPALLQDFLVELAALEWTVSRNPQIAKNVREPIQPLNRKEWGPLLDDGSLEWRLAAAVATQRDRRLSPPLTLSERRSATANVLFRPVTLSATDRKRLEWDERPTISPSGSVTGRLAAAVIKRSVLAADRAGSDTNVLIVGVGGLVAFDCAERVRRADVDAFLKPLGDDRSLVDERRLNRLLAAAALLDGPPRVEWPDSGHPVVADPARAVLGAFFHPRPVRTPATDENPEGHNVLLLPGRSWPRQLHAGRKDGVFREALVRLRTAGFEPAVRAGSVVVPDPRRLLASLLIPVTTGDVQKAIHIVCPQPKDMTQQGKGEDLS